LLSDELTLLDVEQGTIQALSRPISLKNESIGVISRFQPDAVLSPAVSDTVKGTVSLLRPPTDSVRRVGEPARPAWIIFPSYRPDAPAALTKHSKASTCLTFAEQSFNYDIYGSRGFEAVARVIDGCDCFEFSYGDLEDAARAFAELVPSS
jgi:HprK-related kinase A